MSLRKFRIKIDGKLFEAEVEEIGGSSMTAAPSAPRQAAASAAPQPAVFSGSGNAVNAPMPGKIISVKVSKGQQVQAGDVVLILEAMKMEQEIKATSGGTISEILVSAGDTVKKEQALVLIE
jgi:glutaconyl-CoA/methylmalonyl-CoA decarboxylase subunit gamma